MRPLPPRHACRLQRAAAVFAALSLATSSVRADDTAPPSSAEFEAALPAGGSLTGREIYDRFLENRFRRSFQKLRVVSRDPGGSEQTTAFTLSIEDLRNEPDKATVRARILIEVTAPFDVRHTQYLMIDKDPGPDDEFVYQPSERRVRRVGLKKTPLFGTDYTFDDVAYYDIEDADYHRLADSEIDGTPVYVIEASIEETRETQYHRTVSYLEMQHYVPLRIRYWDDYGVEVKQLSAPAASIRAFGETWVATESTMNDLFQRTSSTLHVDHVDTDPDFHAQHFTISHLNKGN
jgi:hypothetical protein